MDSFPKFQFDRIELLTFALYFLLELPSTGWRTLKFSHLYVLGDSLLQAVRHFLLELDERRRYLVLEHTWSLPLMQIRKISWMHKFPSMVTHETETHTTLSHYSYHQVFPLHKILNLLSLVIPIYNFYPLAELNQRIFDSSNRFVIDKVYIL